MNSLRRQLLLWLLPPYLAAAAATTAATYWSYGGMIDQFMDDQLRALGVSYLGQGGAPSLQALDAHSVERWGAPVVQMRNADGSIAANAWPPLLLPAQTAPGFSELQIAGRRWRVYTASSPQRRVQVAQSRDFRQREKFRQALKAGLPLALLVPLSALLLWLAVRRSLRPLQQVARAAAERDERNLAPLPLQRVPEEVRPLVLSINTLLARLGEAFEAQHRFVEDAAHELRTPITALYLQLENLRGALQRSGGGEPVAQFEAGLRRARHLVEQLLRLARQQAPQRTAAPQPVDLAELLKESLTELMPLADRRRIDLGMQAVPLQPVQADRDDLRSLFDNLLDNALRYSPEGGRVDVRLGASGPGAVVEIADQGPGIPPQLRQRVFDRFFRLLGDGGDAEGSGLGLAIARNAAERNGLHIELDQPAAGTGLVARVRFPAPSPA